MVLGILTISLSPIYACTALQNNLNFSKLNSPAAKKTPKNRQINPVEENWADFIPWYTGPNITISATNIPPGQVNINPYFILDDNFGSYNNNWHAKKTSTLLKSNHFWLIEYGITELFDVVIKPSVYYNIKKGSHYFGFDDFSARINLQALLQVPGSWEPSIRFMFQENFPTGKYNKLNPDKHSTDATGSGSFNSIFGLNMEKTVYWIKAHPMRWRINISYSFPTSVHVEGFNTYGGGYNTYGQVHPGNTFNLVTSNEFSFTQRWVLALEMQYQHNRKTSFHGIAGTDALSNPASMGSKSSDVFVMDVTLEYNFTANLGVYGAVAFTFAGRNTSQNVQPALALTYTF